MGQGQIPVHDPSNHARQSFPGNIQRLKREIANGLVPSQPVNVLWIEQETTDQSSLTQIGLHEGEPLSIRLNRKTQHIHGSVTPY